MYSIYRSLCIHTPQNSHIDIAEVAEMVLDHVSMFLSVEHGSQEAAAHLPRLPSSHGGIGRVHDRGHQTGQDVEQKQTNTHLLNSSQGHTLTHTLAYLRISYDSHTNKVVT